MGATSLENVTAVCARPDDASASTPKTVAAVRAAMAARSLEQPIMIQQDTPD
jgi:hypothetical protein